MEILENYKAQFSLNFEENKKTLENISIIRSKGLKNQIAGFITRFLKHEMLDKKKQEERLAKQAKLDEEMQENTDLNYSETEISQIETSHVKEKPQEISETSEQN